MHRKAIVIFFFFGVVHGVFAQPKDSLAIVNSDSARHSPFLTGYALITNNGINLVPTFSLNKPAAMFKFSAGRNRFSFEPEFNFSLEGKPWYFIFWGRYRIVDTKRFRINTALQLGLNYRPVPIEVNGDTTEGLTAERYIAGEIAPTYQVSKNVSLGIYYLHSHGLDPGTTNSLDFLTLNAFFNVNIAREFFLKIVPQLYYLHQDDRHGTYFTSTFTIERNRFPLSISSTINQPLKTNIIGGDKFVWNVALVYSFSVFPSKKS